MLKKLKAAMGAGAATVDAVLTVQAVRPGDGVTGVVKVDGGDVEQEIERITVALETVVEVESGDSEWRSNQTFATNQVTGALTVRPGDKHEFPFQLQVPYETPLTHIGGRPLRGVSMGVRTELEVARGIDRGDLDPIQVHATPGQQALIEALESLGFEFKGADVEQGQLPNGTLPFFQEIEFYAGGQYRGRFNELEVTFLGGPHETRVIFEADTRGGWFSEGRDAYSWFSIPTGGGHLRGTVEQQLQALGQRRGW
ncbi:sporulation protein [Solirubrobacter sp. CPCC 204708]|uniref:Sporulation protein n=1 Tax=Solirubrobacter deserti TaxID=2282478 RepID=A0ABT4RM23_9ACTN|nr:sporulation protein [Solirubrobacter deserti]MBE2314388.1 sporulation protein [Solirubrobacter deserti]MDA0139535.1 sporulation protein [Solirubrobacter deserti]